MRTPNEICEYVTKAIRFLVEQRGLACTTAEACKRLECSRSTLYRWAQDPTNPRVIPLPHNGHHRFFINGRRFGEPATREVDSEE